MLISSILSLFLISAICVLVAFAAKREIRAWKFLVLFLVLVLPTAINETKAALVLLPIGVIIVLMAAAEPGRRLGNMLVAVGLVGVFAAVFIPVYDYLIMPRWGYGLLDFFTMEGRVEGYLQREGADVGTAVEAGRLDTLAVSLRELAEDPLTLFFGLGIGNASDSALGVQYTGAYAEKFAGFTYTSAAKFLLELGVAGCCLVAGLMILVIKDANRVAVSRGVVGLLALGWVAVVAIFGLGLFYKDLHVYASLSMPFWYLSGIVSARRMELALQAPDRMSA